MSKSSLDLWLDKNNLTATAFAERVGCSRPTLLKVKKNIPICPEFARRISELTKDEICPSSAKIGRSW